MERRMFLACVTSAAVGIAGCNDSETTPTATSTDDPLPTATPNNETTTKSKTGVKPPMEVEFRESFDFESTFEYSIEIARENKETKIVDFDCEGFGYVDMDEELAYYETGFTQNTRNNDNGEYTEVLRYFFDGDAIWRRSTSLNNDEWERPDGTDLDQMRSVEEAVPVAVQAFGNDKFEFSSDSSQEFTVFTDEFDRGCFYDLYSVFFFNELTEQALNMTVTPNLEQGVVDSVQVEQTSTAVDDNPPEGNGRFRVSRDEYVEQMQFSELSDYETPALPEE